MNEPIQLPNRSRSFKLKRVIDGDTFEVTIDLDKKIKVVETIRLANFDAPESWRPRNKQEKAHGLKAKACAKYLLRQAQCPFLETVKYDGKYGRRIANIYIDCSDNFIMDTPKQYATLKPWVGFRSVAAILTELNLAKLTTYEELCL